MSGKATVRLPNLPRLKVKKPIITKEANQCLVLMTSLLQCWSSNGANAKVCQGLEGQLKKCTETPIKNGKEQKSNINYHAARLYGRIGGKPHD